MSILLTAARKFLSTPSVWRATSLCGWYANLFSFQFLSTPSVWRATGYHRDTLILLNLLFLSTPSVWRATANASEISSIAQGFLSTPSVWRATMKIQRDCFYGQVISIHALRVEGDSKSSQNIVSFCSTNTKICRSDITKTHTLCFYQNYFVLFYIIFQLSFSAKLPAFFWFLHVRTIYNSSTSSCDHCGQRPICSTFFL